MALSGRQRLNALLHGQAADRLAWTTLVDSNTLDLMPPELRGNGGLDLYRYLGCDILLLDSWGLPQTFRSPQLVWGPNVTVSSETQGDIVNSTWRTPRGTLHSMTRRGHPMQYPVTTLDGIKLYREMWEGAHYVSYDDSPALAEMETALGQDGILTRFWGPSTVPHLLETAMGAEAFYYLANDYPAEMDGLIDAIHTCELDAFRTLAAGPVETVILCENTSSYYISPALYRRHNGRHVADFCRIIHGAGKTALVHMCGHISNLLADISAPACRGYTGSPRRPSAIRLMNTISMSSVKSRSFWVYSIRRYSIPALARKSGARWMRSIRRACAAAALSCGWLPMACLYRSGVLRPCATGWPSTDAVIPRYLVSKSNKQAFNMSRRVFMRGALASLAGVLLMSCKPDMQSSTRIQTVLGSIAPAEMGSTLPHEHIMCDFIGADKVSPARYQVDEIVMRMEPYLCDLVRQGVRTFIDCTPAYLARDVEVLRRLAQRTSMHILTNTGWYKAPYLPQRAFSSTAEQIAEEWIAEWRDGIRPSGIKPGFIKIAVNPGKLENVQRKIVRAAALTHLASGMVVACHTGEAAAAYESLDIIEAEKMNPARYIIVHADQIPAWGDHVALFKRGAWLEYDALGTRALEADIALIQRALDAGYGSQLLLSQDAGWYNVGQPDGGTVRPFTALYASILPALTQAGVAKAAITELTVTNPARAFAASA
ncbi:MAG: hypothetical protein LLG44_04655 [Chloroflexi bacterium]|nr:hypothetical protein [Chloroflexota bacterium]